MTPLPIDSVLPELLAALQSAPCAVLRAPTGAGKTTRVPPALLDHIPGRIYLLEPRRLAARAAARRMAVERGEPLGRTIGYHVRFDRVVGPLTRIVVVTPGILLRHLHDDPYLETAGAVVFDEFHERGLESDLALGFVHLIRQAVRPELRIVVMSATLEVEDVARYLGGCPVVHSEGRAFPVEIVHEDRPPHLSLGEAVAAAIGRALKRTDGDVLAFLPGMAEIRQTQRALTALAEQQDLAVLPLHGDLTPEMQDAALSPQDRRKVVLATNVAETSVTVAGITAVVDSGLARILRFDPAVGLDRLELEPISRASADQRAGRAGRTRPGVCIRLWNERNHAQRPRQTDPEIRRVDLAGAVLQLLASGERDPARFPWLEPPGEAAAIDTALSLLRRLGARDDGGVTELGRSMAKLPVHPRLARMLLEGRRRGCGDRAALAAALIAERDPFVRDGQKSPPPTESDVADRVDALEEFERTGRTDTPSGELHRAAAREVLRARDQLARTMRDWPQGRSETGDDGLLRAVFAGFPDRLAKRRNPGGNRALMVGGVGAKLAPSSGVTRAELFVAVDADARAAELVVRLASAVRRDWLPDERLSVTIELEYEASADRVSARRRVRFDDLLLEEGPAALPDDVTVARALALAARERPDKVLPSDDSPAGQFLNRCRFLREQMPELDLPNLEPTDILEEICVGRRSLAELRTAPWPDHFRGRFSHSQLQMLEREAPEAISLPSGRKAALKYEAGRPPVLAVKIQDLFGRSDTPRVAGGRVKVVLHLLAPNGRPQQVTDDLASFWANTYPRVRKDLRGRYPKHPWPEDPTTFAPQR